MERQFPSAPLQLPRQVPHLSQALRALYPRLLPDRLDLGVEGQDRDSPGA